MEEGEYERGLARAVIGALGMGGDGAVLTVRRTADGTIRIASAAKTVLSYLGELDEVLTQVGVPDGIAQEILDKYACALRAGMADPR